MGILRAIRQDLHARADTDSKGTGWGTIQIITPIIVGVGLLLCFAAYIVWQRRRGSSSNARPTHWEDSPFVRKFGQVFSSPGRRVRHRVTHSSGLVTLDDSMASPCVRIDFQHRVRQYSADSTDSSTPLTYSVQNDDDPPKSPPDCPRNATNRRWSQQFLRFIGLGPQEVKSGAPGVNWRIDVSSTGHGHDSNVPQGCATNGGFEGDNEDDAFDMDGVMAIGDANFSSIASTNDPGRPPPIAPNLASKLASTNHSPLSVSRARERSDSPPPLYHPATPSAQRHHQHRDQDHVRQPSGADVIYPSDTSQLFPAAVRAVYGNSFRFPDPRISSDSLLASQTPMSVPTMH